MANPRSAPMPAGCRFCPNDRELLRYLKKKVTTGGSSEGPDVGYMREGDLYGQQEPWEIWRYFQREPCHHPDNLYLFSKLKANRKVGTGRWIEVEEEDTKIWDDDDDDDDDDSNSNSIMGFKRKFRYQKLSTPPEMWIMVEYWLPEEASSYIICVLSQPGASKHSSTAS